MYTVALVPNSRAAQDSIPELMEKRGTHDVFGQAETAQSRIFRKRRRTKKVQEKVKNAS